MYLISLSRSCSRLSSMRGTPYTGGAATVVAVVVDLVAEVRGGGSGVDTSVLGIYPLESG